jgi:SAM-dependent methyltransferase
MLLKETLKHALRTVGSVPLVSRVLFDDRVRRRLERLPGSNALYGGGGWQRLHPFDRALGSDTSGTTSSQDLKAAGDHEALAHVTFYGGSQPSVLRRVLATLPQPENSTFIDLGCGKGRPLLVASEFPFRDIVGVELSPRLAQVARANAALVGARYPTRTPIRIEVGDATAFPLPAGNLVLFLYHPFGTELVLKVVRTVEAALASEERAIYVVLYNPVNGACFDASPRLTRRFAAMVPYDREELGYGPDTADAIVVWQGGTAPAPTAEANARIVVTLPGTRAELAA